jgi:hypothetical protein
MSTPPKRPTTSGSGPETLAAYHIRVGNVDETLPLAVALEQVAPGRVERAVQNANRIIGRFVPRASTARGPHVQALPACLQRLRVPAVTIAHGHVGPCYAVPLETRHAPSSLQR